MSDEPNSKLKPSLSRNLFLNSFIPDLEDGGGIGSTSPLIVSQPHEKLLNNIYSRRESEFKVKARSLITPQTYWDDLDNQESPNQNNEEPLEQMNELKVKNTLQRMRIVGSLKDFEVRTSLPASKSRDLISGETPSVFKSEIEDEQPDPNQPFRCTKEGAINLNNLRLPEFGSLDIRKDLTQDEAMPSPEISESKWDLPEPESFADRVFRIREVVEKLPRRYDDRATAPLNGVNASAQVREGRANRDTPLVLKSALLDFLQKKKYKAKMNSLKSKTGWSQTVSIARRSREEIRRERQLRTEMKERKNSEFKDGLFDEEIKAFEENEEDYLQQDDEILRQEAAAAKKKSFSSPDLIQIPFVRDLGRGWNGMMADSYFLFSDWTVDALAVEAEKVKEAIVYGPSSSQKLKSKEEDFRFVKMLLKKPIVDVHQEELLAASKGSPKRKKSEMVLSALSVKGGGTGGMGGKSKPYEDMLRFKAEAASLMHMWKQAQEKVRRQEEKLKAEGIASPRRKSNRKDKVENFKTMSIFKFAS
eukprot:GDKJ01018400.1.p1 GENE.GDKJ01018400.1~~GDKJ01018400.1.p1  ORF type:complete len:532 (-),score=113.90 GDKJ01018400.1:133-1728(-)